MRIKEFVAAAMLATASVDHAVAQSGIPNHEELENDRKPKDDEKKETKEKPEVRVPYVYTGPLFKIDDYTNVTEGTPDVRKKLVMELVEEIMSTTVTQKEKDRLGEEYSFWRKTYPLFADGKNLEILVSIYPDQSLLAITVADPAQPGETAIVLRDEGMTGTPSAHQLPIQLQGKNIPQGFMVSSEDSIATKLYLGLLKHMLSKF